MRQNRLSLLIAIWHFQINHSWCSLCPLWFLPLLLCVLRGYPSISFVNLKFTSFETSPIMVQVSPDASA